MANQDTSRGMFPRPQPERNIGGKPDGLQNSVSKAGKGGIGAGKTTVWFAIR